MTALDRALNQLKELSTEQKIRSVLEKELHNYKCDLLTNTDLPLTDIVDRIVLQFKENNVL